jgi:hypothetical protein
MGNVMRKKGFGPWLFIILQGRNSADIGTIIQ